MKFFSKIKNNNTNNSIKCLACRHYCIIPLNSFGICGARKNINKELVLLTHSHPTSIHLDPIEKKPLYHFYPNSKIMSIGFFGCNFKCDFCQNSEISFTKRTQLENNLINLNKLSPKDFVKLAIKEKAESIAFTYNEPAISVEYNLEAIKETNKFKKENKEKGKNKLNSVYVSNGYLSSEQIKELTKKSTRLDAINIDLKSFNDNFYKTTCGGELDKVLNCIKEIHKKGIWIELTTLIIPNKNNSNKELTQIASWIKTLDKNIPWHVSAFFPMHKMQKISPTNESELNKAITIGKENGLNFVYGGNMNKSSINSNTYCPKCNSLLIKRNGFNANTIGLSKGKCINCKEKIKGIFYE